MLLPAAAVCFGTTAVSLPSHAQGDPGMRIEEVIVTARYRQESLQETPIAITALSGDELAIRGFEEIQEIGRSIPNAYIRPGNAATGPAPTIAIRGVSQSDFNYALEPGVAVYIDDIYHGTLTGSSFDLVDVERIEVLRGPQGTLFGKNSLGGAVRLVSKKPQGDNSGHVEATYGSFRRTDIKASYDFSLIEDRLFARVTAASKHREGYQDQLDFTCQMVANGTPHLAGIGDGIGADGSAGGALDGQPDVVAAGSAADNDFAFPRIRGGGQQNGGDCKIGTLGGEDVQAIRAMVRFIASPDLEFNLSAEYSDDDSEAVPITLLTEDTSASSRNNFSNRLVYPNYGIHYDGRFIANSRYQTYETFADPITGAVWPNSSAVETIGLSASMDYQIVPAVHAKLILGYREYDSEFTSQGDGSPLKESVLYNATEHEQRSVELQLTGQAFGDRLEWTLGGFYYEADSFLGGRAEFNTNGLMFDNNDRFDTENKSAFTHLVFNVTDAIALTGGLRYTNEEKGYAFDHTGFLTVDTPAVASDERTDWKAGIDFQATDSLLVYASVSTGFRSAGFQPRPFTAIQLLPFPSEELTSYEIGAKADWFDNRLRTNVAAFYSDYDPRVVQVRGSQCAPNTTPDQQPYLGGPVCPPGTPLAGTSGFPWAPYISGPATVQGFEAELTAQPTDNLSITAAVGYNEFESKQDDPRAPNYFHPDFLLQPQWNASVGLQYEVSLGDAGSLIPRLDWFYTSKATFSDLVNVAPGPTDIIDAYSLINARITYQSSDRDWTVALSATNLTDKFYWYGFRGSNVNGREGTPGRPREWAMTVTRNF